MEECWNVFDFKLILKREELFMPYMPYVIEEHAHGERSYDVFSRLLKDRIIFLAGEITDVTADLVIAQMLFLESQDPDKDINLYINSPGGSVAAGMAIYDTMQFIKPDVATICFGIAASMASVLLMAGAKGKRFALSHAEVLIHQPLGGTMGQASDIEIHAKHILRIREEMYKVIMLHTGQARERIVADTDRDTYLTACEALDYGIIDKVMKKRA